MLLKLKNYKGEEILIGVESIIDIAPFVLKSSNGTQTNCTRIQSRGAMVETNYVTQSVAEIYEQYQKIR